MPFLLSNDGEGKAVDALVDFEGEYVGHTAEVVDDGHYAGL